MGGKSSEDAPDALEGPLTRVAAKLVGTTETQSRREPRRWALRHPGWRSAPTAISEAQPRG